MAKLRSALESFRAKMDEDDAGTEVNITVVVDAEAEAVEEALEEQEVQGEAAEAEALADANEAAEEEAAELVAIAGVLRNYGLTPGMSALLKASGMEARYGIRMPAMESLDTTGRNQGKADSIAAALEASSDSFWQKTKNFMAEMWDKVKRFFIWLSTKVGTLKGRVERAFKALEGKSWDEEKGKNAGKYRLLENSTTIGTEIWKLFDQIRTTSVIYVNVAHQLNNPDTFKNMTDADAKKFFVDKRPDEALLKTALGYKYSDADAPFKVEADDKDFLKGKEFTMDEKTFTMLKTDGKKTVFGILEQMARQDVLIKACDEGSKNSIKLVEDLGKLSDDAREGASKMLSHLKDSAAFWVKVASRGNAVLRTVVKQYIVMCTRARACAKA